MSADFTVTGMRVVVEVARTGSFSAAADALGYTQSAVSRQVAAAEAAAGSPLFTRHARGVRPTAAGEVLLRYAGRVLESVAGASQELAGLRDLLVGRVVVGGFPTAMVALVPRAVAAARTEHPGLEVGVLEGSSPQLLTAVRRRRAAVAVVAAGEGLPDHDLDGLDLTTLRPARGPGIAVADGHHLASRAWVTPDDLADQPWVIGRSTAESPEFGAWPGLDSPVVAFTVRDWPARLGLVQAGLGIALVPGLAADVVPAGVTWVPVRSDALPRRTLYAVSLPGPDAATRAVVDVLAETAAALG